MSSFGTDKAVDMSLVAKIILPYVSITSSTIAKFLLVASFLYPSKFKTSLGISQ